MLFQRVCIARTAESVEDEDDDDGGGRVVSSSSIRRHVDVNDTSRRLQCGTSRRCLLAIDELDSERNAIYSVAANHYFALERAAKYCDDYVRLSVRLHSSKITQSNFTSFYRATLCYRGICRRRVSVYLCVYLSVTLRYCIKTAKRGITQIKPHDGQGTLSFFMPKITAKFELDHPVLLGRQMQVG